MFFGLSSKVRGNSIFLKRHWDIRAKCILFLNHEDCRYFLFKVRIIIIHTSAVHSRVQLLVNPLAGYFRSSNVGMALFLESLRLQKEVIATEINVPNGRRAALRQGSVIVYLISRRTSDPRSYTAAPGTRIIYCPRVTRIIRQEPNRQNRYRMMKNYMRKLQYSEPSG